MLYLMDVKVCVAFFAINPVFFLCGSEWMRIRQDKTRGQGESCAMGSHTMSVHVTFKACGKTKQSTDVYLIMMTVLIFVFRF